MGQQLISMMTSMTCLILGILYVIGGLVKLIPFPQFAHHAQVHAFRGFASVFPLKLLGVIPDADTYRITVGVLEVILGFVMLLPNNTTRLVSAFGLGVITFTVALALVMLQQYMSAIITEFLFIGLLWVYKTVGQSKIKEE